MNLFCLFFVMPSFAATDLSKCNIETQSDPNNKIECYQSFPAALVPGMKLAGWPKDTKLKKSPSDASATLQALVPSGHWTDEEIELTGKTDGEWAEVVLRKFRQKRTSCEDSRLEKWTKRGWIKAVGKDGKPLLWNWLYSGLC